MATITLRTAKDGSKSYRVEVRLKGYPPQRATFARLTDARAWARDTESDIKRGRHFTTAEAKRHTVAELLDRYSRDVLPRKKATTQHAQRIQLDWWKDQLARLRLRPTSHDFAALHTKLDSSASIWRPQAI